MPRYRSRLPQNQDNDSSTLLTLFKWLLQTVRSPGYALTLVLALQVSMIEPSRADERSEYDDDALDTVDNNLVSSLANDISTDHLDLTVEDWDLSQLSSYDSEPGLTGSVLDRQSDANSEAECPAKGPSPASPLSYVRMQLLAYNNVQIKQVELDLWQNIWALARIDDNQNTLMMKWSKYGNLQWAKELVNLTQQPGAANPLALTPTGQAWFTGSIEQQAVSQMAFGKMSKSGDIDLVKRSNSNITTYGQSLILQQPSSYKDNPSLWLAGSSYQTNKVPGFYVANIASDGNPRYLNRIPGENVNYHQTSVLIRYNSQGPIMAAYGDYHGYRNSQKHPFYLAQFNNTGHLLTFKAFYSDFQGSTTKTIIKDLRVAQDGSVRVLADLNWYNERFYGRCFNPLLIKMTSSYEVSWSKTFESLSLSSCPRNAGGSLHINQDQSVWMTGNLSMIQPRIQNKTFISQIGDNGSLLQAVSTKTNFKGNLAESLVEGADSTLYMGGYYLLNGKNYYPTFSRVISYANKSIEGEAFQSIYHPVHLANRTLKTVNRTAPGQYQKQFETENIKLNTQPISFDQIILNAHGKNPYYPAIEVQPGILSQYPLYQFSFGSQHHAQDLSVRLTNGSDLPNWLTYHPKSGLLDILYPVDEPPNYLSLNRISLITGQKTPFWLTTAGTRCLRTQAFISGIQSLQYIHGAEIADITSDQDNNTFLLGTRHKHFNDEKSLALFIAKQNNDSSLGWIKTLTNKRHIGYRGIKLAMTPSNEVLLTGQIGRKTPDTQTFDVAYFFWSYMSTSGDILQTKTMGGAIGLDDFEDIAFDRNGTIAGTGGFMICKVETPQHQCKDIHIYFSDDYSQRSWNSLAKDDKLDVFWLTGWATNQKVSLKEQASNLTQQDHSLPNQMLSLAQVNQQDLTVNWAKTLDIPYSSYGNVVTKAQDGSIWLAGYLGDDLNYFVANFNEWGLINWHKVIAGHSTIFDGNYLPTLKKSRALTHMPDGSIITATPWRPKADTYARILLLHWNPGGEIKKAATINNNYKDMYVYTVHNNDYSLKVGTDDGFFSLPYFDSDHPLSPDYWYIPNSEWSFHTVDPMTYTMNMITRLLLHREVSPFKPDITSTSLQVNETPYLLRPFPHLAAPSLAQTVEYQHPFSINLLQNTPPHYGNIFLNKINLNNGFTWLKADFTNHRINGTPTGLVRGRYPVDFQLKYGIERPFKLSYQMVINVPNKPPYYAGPRKIRFFIDGLDVSSVIPKHFFDPENDTITSYDLETTSSSPLWLNLNTKTGVMSATMISGYQGNYTIDVLATDQFGGIGSQTIQLEVPNRSPNITLAPQTVYVNNIRTLAIPQQDQDGDRIEIQSIQFDEQSGLPSWITLSQESNTLVFTPKTDDQGPHHIKVNMRDCFQHTHSKHQHCGHTVSSLFNLTVPNRPPVLKHPFSEGIIHVFEHWQYAVTDHFKDPDGDSLRYKVKDAPGWLQYDSYTQQLKAHLTSFPGDTHYGATVHALDGHGGRAQAHLNLKVIRHPNVSLSQIAKWGLIGGASFLGIALLCANIWFQRRRRKSWEKQIYQLLNALLLQPTTSQASASPSSQQLIDDFDQRITRQRHHLEGAYENFFDWAQQLHRHYLYTDEDNLLPISHLLVGQRFIEELAQQLRTQSTQQQPDQKSLRTLSQFLFHSCFLLMVFYSVRDNQLHIEDKNKMVNSLDGLLTDRQEGICGSYPIDSNSTDAIITLHQLICARQILLCAKDNQTTSSLLLNAALNIISPRDLFVGAYHMWHDTPSSWFMKFIQMWHGRTKIRLQRADNEQAELQGLQRMINKETNWAFRLSAVDIFVDLINHYATNPPMLDQLIKGSPGCLGFVELLTQPQANPDNWSTTLSCRRQHKRQQQWVANYAHKRLNSLSDNLISYIKQSATGASPNQSPLSNEVETTPRTLPYDSLFACQSLQGLSENNAPDTANLERILAYYGEGYNDNMSSCGQFLGRVRRRLHQCCTHNANVDSEDDDHYFELT